LKSVQSLPQWIGFFLLIIGFMFLVPLIALMHIYSIPELWQKVIVDTGWHYMMFLWIVADIFLVGLIFAYAGEIIWYKDKEAEVKSIKENADASEFKPKESEVEEE